MQGVDPMSEKERELWRLVETPPADGAYNMALDEALMLLVRRPVLRLYRWMPPAISLGYFQSSSSPNLSEYAESGYTIVRRPTGGGAICHINEITFSVVTPAEHPLAVSSRRAYDVVHSAIVDALSAVGVSATIRGEGKEKPPNKFLCFERIISCDIVSSGLKLVGSAQRRTKGGFLQHGSIPLEKNPLAECGYVNLFSPRNVSYEMLRNAIVDSFRKRLRIDFVRSEPTDEEKSLASELIKKRYANPEWTFRR